MDDPHRICELEKEIVRLQTKSDGDDKALVLARDIADAQTKAMEAQYKADTAKDRSNVSIVISVIVMLLLLLTYIKR